MTRDELINKLVSLRRALEAEGVQHVALFGSRARGDHRPDSDLDMLLEVAPTSQFSLLNLVGVEQIVADATGLQTHATMRRSLDHDPERSVRHNLVEVF